jgi:hypothetical protein
MDTGFLRVLFDPGRFFEERMRGEAGLKIPIGVRLILKAGFPPPSF